LLSRVFISNTCAIGRRYFSSASPAAKGKKVTVLGAAGGIGQPLSLLLKNSPYVSHLNLYDIVNTPGVAADLSHINTPAKVAGFVGDEQLKDALTGSQVIVIPAGVPRKPGMTRDDLFNTNATIVYNLATAIAKHAPTAHVLVIANPVNSTVPIVAEVFKKNNVYNPKRLFGVTSLDIVRANTFVAELKGLDVNKLNITVVGGHSGVTILPLLSQVPGLKLTQAETEQLTNRIQFGGDEVVKAKAGTGSATLSMAYAGLRFTESLLRALNGEKGVSECTYVESKVTKELTFFSSRVELGTEGVTKINEVGKLSDYEQKLFKEMVPELQKNIQKGVEFVASKK